MKLKVCTDCTTRSQCEAVQACVEQWRIMNPSGMYTSFFADYMENGRLRKMEFPNKPMAEAHVSRLLATRPQVVMSAEITKVTREVVRRMK